MRSGTLTSLEDALAFAIARAAEAQRWDVVTQLAAELHARRLAAAGNVSELGARGRGPRR